MALIVGLKKRPNLGRRGSFRALLFVRGDLMQQVSRADDTLDVRFGRKCGICNVIIGLGIKRVANGATPTKRLTRAEA